MLSFPTLLRTHVSHYMRGVLPFFLRLCYNTRESETEE